MGDTSCGWRIGCYDVSLSAIAARISNLSVPFEVSPWGCGELGVGNESSWAIMNVLIQVCFDEIPPDWSQITEQNSESLLTTVMKAILAGNMMGERWSTSRIPSGYFTPLLNFLPTSSVISHWVGWNLMSVYICTNVYGRHTSTMHLYKKRKHPEENWNKWDIIYGCNPELGPGVTNMHMCSNKDLWAP